MTRKRITYQEAAGVARVLASRWGPAPWLRGIGVVGDKHLDESFAVEVVGAKERRSSPPPELAGLRDEDEVEGVPVYLVWRAMARPRPASARSGFGALDA